MKRVTRNGFTTIDPGEKHRLVTFKVAGRSVTCRREAAALMRKLVELLHQVEPITETGWDGSYASRPVRGTTDVPSEHAAGTAYDHNASQHPRGAGDTVGWSPVQVRWIRWWLENTAAGRCFKWGADFGGTEDAMHFEIRSPEHLARWNEARR